MSVKQMGKAWELELPAPQLLVLLALADHADHDGNNVYPSTRLIAWKTGYSERQIRRIIDSLLTDGLMAIVEERPGETTIYRLTLQNGKPKEPLTKCHPSKNVTPDIAMSDPPLTKRHTTPDIAMSPEPSFKPSNEPSIETPLQQVISCHEKNIGAIATSIVQGTRQCIGMVEALEEYPFEWIIEAIELTPIRTPKRTWGYAVGILKNWKAFGKDTPKPTNGNGHHTPEPIRSERVIE